MSTLEAIVLGIVQGLTEFLPISSTGHILYVPALAGWPDPGAAFSAVIQLGTMAAVLVYFRAELWRMAVAFLKSFTGDHPLWRSADTDGRLGWYIVLGTIPISIVGLVFKDQIENNVRTISLVATVMILFSFVLMAADLRGAQNRDVKELTLRDGIIIGLFQALALIPGVSRSGSTISGGLFLGLDRESATRYSFLLSVPAVVLSGIFELRNIGDSTGASVGFGPTAIATVLAFVTGYAAIAFLLRFVRTHNFSVFVVYRVAVGVLMLVLVAAGAVS
ncbi:MAG: undecaprenyl-diphosphate phosphatase [Actinobacteria bacterium]|uniref:Undecaprenyl-diphosphatase n=1 Tax=freshwater metagenome TaxID=449393 RepID=A0A6J5ZUY8_9ZZZZ|nr:undecaprenyl-diphosphate phosphatase [Actinomycetota bacterium]